VQINYLLVLLLAGTFSVFAQNPAKSLTDSAAIVNYSIISGKIEDSTASGPVPFATVALYNAENNKLLGGAVADGNGAFIIGRVLPGNYRLAISYIGYSTKNIGPIVVKEGMEKTDIQTVKLQSSDQKLKEVVITGQRSLIEEKVDRTIYNAEFDATNKGGDATDVLRKAPMLSVDMDGNVSMRGSQNVKILINNKPTTMAANSIADALKMIPADLIQSVEIITSPSAKYDAEGSAGIINIVLKENKLQGFTLGVDGSAGIRGSNLGVTGNYKTLKMAFSLGGMGRFRYNTPGSFLTEQTTIATNGTQSLTKQSANTQNQMGAGIIRWDGSMRSTNPIRSMRPSNIRSGTAS